MLFFNWEDSFYVNIDSLDKQHKKIVDLINNAHKELTEEKRPDESGKIIEELLEYTEYHFEFEENLLEKYSYPAITTHIKQHEDLRKKVSSLKNDLDMGEGIEPLNLLAFLVDWLQDHIVGSDKKYSSLLINNGVR